jgi:CBS domain-containing protein
MSKPRTARELMQSPVVALAPDDPIHVAYRLFAQEGIHGAPVVDDLGRVVGLLSSSDLLRAALDAKEVSPSEPGFYREDLDAVFGGWGLAPEDFKERVRDAVVSEYMSEEIVKVAPDAPVSEAARLMRENRIHRVLVVDDGSLCGILSSFDLIALLEE